MKRIGLMSVIVVLVMFSLVALSYAADKGIASADKKFITKAASGNMMEVQAGQLAQQKAQSEDVKSFASQMVTDHSKANDELKQLAEQKNVKLSSEMNRKDKSALKKISDLKPEEFDKKYMAQMVKDHTKDVADFRKAAQKVKDPDLKDWINKTLPVLEQHLKLAKDTAAKVGAK